MGEVTRKLLASAYVVCALWALFICGGTLQEFFARGATTAGRHDAFIGCALGLAPIVVLYGVQMWLTWLVAPARRSGRRE